MARTKDETIREVTQNYLGTINPKNPPTPANIQGDILDELKAAFDLENTVKGKGEKWKIMDRLLPAQIADILSTIYPILCIACAGESADRSYDLLAIYQTDGPDEGIYVSDEMIFHHLARQYCYTINKRELEEVLHILKNTVPRKTRCNQRNLIAVNNGIFDFDTKTLLPFSPDYVFIAKSHVNYNPLATNIIIHNNEDGTDWDIESWMDDLFDDNEIVSSIWEIIGAIIRPNVPWGKSAWFYSTSGNNGKGTLCELMRQICGKSTYASISLSDFSKDFMLEPLTKASAIIVDENDVGTYIDKAANLKAIITNDVIQMNRKFKSPIAFQFKGFMVQCLNEFPKIRDKSDSFYRRQLFIPFTKCFTGAERKYIKNDYLQRQEVLEYVLYKVLNMNYYVLSTPTACKNALEEYKEFNDPVRQFVNEIFPELQWDLVPFSFLYDLYGAWYRKNVGKSDIVSRQSFVQNLINILGPDNDFVCEDKSKKYKPSTKMDKAEPLIMEYDLKAWINPMMMSSNDMNKRCHPVLKPNYRGLLRRP